jgi:glycosyltransferase involved in cell wall biosynthesis
MAMVVQHASLDDERTLELIEVADRCSAGADIVFVEPGTELPSGTDVVVYPADVSTTFDPAGEVDRPIMIAWVHDFPTEWIRRRGLDWFDVVVCGSRALQDSLAPLFAGTIALLPDATRGDGLLSIVTAARPEAGTATIVGYHPNYWDHPYVQKLYRGLRSLSARAVPVTGPQQLLGAPGLHHRSVFHLQWTASILADATSERDALDRAGEFLGQVDRLKARGTPVVWTIHNVLPHECAHPNAEINLCAGMAERSDAIHVLNHATLAETAGRYALPADRIRVIPYDEDAVVPTISRAEARNRLSLARDDVVFLAFGRIRPYKQLGRLLDAFAEHRRSHPRSRLVVAGLLERFSGSRQLGARCRRESGVVARLGRVADDQVETLFAASDATVISYRVLNSGVAITAVAHGCPVGALDVGGLADVISNDGGLLVDPETRLVELLDRLYQLVTETDVRARVAELGRSRSSATMAARFADLIDELMVTDG